MMIGYMKKLLLGTVLTVGLCLRGAEAAEPMDWKDFGNQQKDILVDGTVGEAKRSFNSTKDDISHLDDGVKEVGQSWKNVGQEWDNAGQSWKESGQGWKNIGQDTEQELKDIGQGWKDAGQNWKKEMQDSLKGSQSDNSKWIDLGVQKIDEKTGGTASVVRDVIREGQGLKNDFENVRQNWENAGDTLKNSAKNQALNRLDTASGGLVGETNSTVNSFKNLKKNVKNLKTAPETIKTNMVNRVDSELKDVTKVMDITGDFKGKAGSASAFGDVLGMAQQSFGSIAKIDQDHNFGGGIVQRLVDEFAKHSIGEIAGKDSAFSSIQSAIGGLSSGGGFLGEDLKMLGDAQADFNALRNHNLSLKAGNMLSQVQSDVQKTVADKVTGIVNSAGDLVKRNQVQLKISGMPHGGTINFGEMSASVGDKHGSITALHEGADGMAEMIGSFGGMSSLVDPRAMTALKLQSYFSKAGTGIPSIDPLNATLGVFNVESVYGHSYEYEDMRDLNMQYCSAMGVGDPEWRQKIQSGQESAGAFCCEQWLDVQAHSLNTMVGLLTSPGNIVDALSSASMLKEYCCATSPGICDTLGTKKAECVNGALQGGATAEGAWQQCAVECGNTDYGALVYNPETGYDPNQVTELVKGCYKIESWVPSNTVLSSSEMTPIVPSGVKDVLVNGRSAMQKASSTLDQTPTNMSNTAGDFLGGMLGDTLAATGVSDLAGAVNGAVGDINNEMQAISNDLGGIGK